MTDEGVSVLAVDDQPIFLDAAHDVVVATPGFDWVGGATSGAEALDAVEELHPALVLLDVRMPGMDGFETAQRISERHPEVVVVLISIEDHSGFAPTVEASGAAALVRKQDFRPSVLRGLWEAWGRS
jgi:DNA-binding NarL/FixJ family response regulator